jgi:phage tail-like protein
MDREELKKGCIGLDVYKARNRVRKILPELDEQCIDITFRESDLPRYTVIDCVYNEQRNTVMLYAASGNPIMHLPSNYQENDFLRNFLMIFQHLNNEVGLTIDTMYENFRPMECSAKFLPMLADWFGVDLNQLGGEDEIRKFLQYAIPLYRYRGTALGLRAYLYVVSGIVPQIIEGRIPYDSMEFSENTEVTADILELEDNDSVFSVYFPVESEQMDFGLIRRLARIIQAEKPVHTRCYLCFKKQEIKKRHERILTNDTVMGEEGDVLI